MGQIETFGAVEMGEGEGAVVRRVFPTLRHGSIDPFVLLDEFFVGPDAGFPDHPHKGFEAITYMLEGAFRHRDSLGNDTEVSAGGVQHFSAGKGIVHAALPGNFPMNHGLQLWINLPESRKSSEPTYQQVESAQIPEMGRKGARIRTIIGENSPVQVQARVIYRDILLEAGGSSLVVAKEGYQGVVYLFEGAATLDSTDIHPGEAVKINSGSENRIRSSGGARFVEILGIALNRRIVIHGSFVE